MICRAVLPSETFARKAQRILTANGYISEMIRITNVNAGCGYALRIVGKPEEIQAILAKANIPVRSLESERDGL